MLDTEETVSSSSDMREIAPHLKTISIYSKSEKGGEIKNLLISRISCTFKRCTGKSIHNLKVFFR